MKMTTWFATVLLSCVTSSLQAGLFDRSLGTIGATHSNTSMEMVAHSVLASAPTHVSYESGHGYASESWFGGCCPREPSCCDHVWDGYCGSRWHKNWCAKLCSLRLAWHGLSCHHTPSCCYHAGHGHLGSGCDSCGDSGHAGCGCGCGKNLLCGWKPGHLLRRLLTTCHCGQPACDDCGCDNCHGDSTYAEGETVYDDGTIIDQSNPSDMPTNPTPAPADEITPPVPPQLDTSAQIRPIWSLPADA